MADDYRPGRVAMYPPSGAPEATYFLERQVETQLGMGWTFQPAPKKTTARRAPVTTSATTDKPKPESQGTEE